MGKTNKKNIPPKDTPGTSKDTPRKSRGRPSTSSSSKNESRTRGGHISKRISTPARPKKSNFPTVERVREDIHARPLRLQNASAQKISLKIINEIKKLQLSTQHVIPKAAFSRLVREVSQDLVSGCSLRWTFESVVALQEASERYIWQLFEDSNLCTYHRSKATLMVKDMKLVLLLRAEFDRVAKDSANL